MTEEQKIYSLKQLEEWIEDALESEATPEEIHDVIIHTVERSATYHRACLNHSARLLSLLEDKITIEGYDDFELPLPKQDNVVKISDYIATEKDYWEGRVAGKEFNNYLKMYGYEYTPSRFKLDSPYLHDSSQWPDYTELENDKEND